MSENPTTTRTGPWRIAVLDRSDDDPKWLLATIAPGDVRPAPHIGTDLDELTAWAAARAGLHVPALTRLRHAEVYRIDERRPPPDNLTTAPQPPARPRGGARRGLGVVGACGG